MNQEKSKILIVVFILLILLSGIIVVRKIKKPVSIPNEVKQENTTLTQAPELESIQTDNNIIRIKSDVNSITVGESFETSVSFLAPGRKIFGSDLVILYDPVFLSTDQTRVVQGTFFAITPRINVDAENGIIKISAYQGIGDISDESIEIVKINFTSLKQGSSQIGLSFTKGTTNTTTLVEAETSQNILDNVENLTIAVN